MIEDRVQGLEEHLRTVDRRLRALEGRKAGSPAPAPAPAQAKPVNVRARMKPVEGAKARPQAKARPEVVASPVLSPPSRPAPEAQATRKKAQGQGLEDLFGGQVLAWVGGIAILVGMVLLLAIGISSGWIGEGARTILAGAGSVALLGIGFHFHERRGRTDAALAALSAGVASSFLTVVVATQVYGLLPDAVGLALSLGVGAFATAVAVRWESQGIAGLGIVGALLSPVLAGASMTAGSVAVLFVAGLAAAGVLLWMRWEWLALVAYAVATPQWASWVLDHAGTAGALTALVAFGLLGVATAIGYELRSPSERLRASSTFLLILNALVLALTGWFAFDQHLDSTIIAQGWLVGLALAHLAVGLLGARTKRVSDDLALVTITAGVILGDVAFGLIASGVALTAGWAGTGVLFAAIAKRRRGGSEQETVALHLGLGAHVTMALVHVLASDAPPRVLADGGSLTVTAVAGLLTLAAGCFASARLADEGHTELRGTLDAVGLAAVAYLTAITTDHTWQLGAAWALESAALARIASRSGDGVATGGAIAFGTGALACGIAVVPPSALIDGLHEPLGAAIALAAVAFAAGVAVWLRVGGDEARPALAGTAALVLLYLASAAVVTPFQPGSDTVAPISEVGIRQEGQMVLSVFWALVGVTALGVGLRREALRDVRLAALTLLGLTVGKVFLFDLSTLGSMYRVVSFIGLGAFLLAGAFLWQRMRPKPLPDMRDAAPGIR